MKILREVDNTTLELSFESLDERKRLEKLVSYKVPGHEFSPSYLTGHWDGTKCFLSPKNCIKKGIFKSLFPDHQSVYDTNFVDLSFNDIPLYKNNKAYERREYQLKAINSILRHKHGIICSTVGSGKTLISAATISYLLSKNNKTKVLFVVYDKNILSQSITNFTRYGFNVSQYGNNIKDLSGEIVVATIQSLSRIENPKKILKDFTACWADESHHTKSKTSKTVLTKLVNCKYFIGLTATPPKERTLELATLMSVLGPIIFNYDMKQSVANGNIAPVKCIFYKLPFNSEVKGSVITKRNYKYIWETAICNSPQRNNAITELVKNVVMLLNAPGLIYVDRVLHGNEIANKLLCNSQIKLCQMYGSDNIMVRDMKKEQLMNDDINVLVSSVVTEGIDMRISPVIAVNAAGRKNFISQIQFLGRIVRANQKFGSFRILYDFIDTAHPLLKKHSEERIQNCRDTGSDVIICSSLNEVLLETVKYYKQCNKD